MMRSGTFRPVKVSSTHTSHPCDVVRSRQFYRRVLRVLQRQSVPGGSRRWFLRSAILGSGLTLAAPLLAACASTPAAAPTVAPTAAPAAAAPAQATPTPAPLLTAPTVTVSANSAPSTIAGPE